jgi:glutathione peroxidase
MHAKLRCVLGHCRYQVTFPLFKKVEVNGPHAHPVFKYLNILNSAQTDALAADWNFNKYLVDRQGHPLKHYASAFNEAELENDIEKALGSELSQKGVSYSR